MPARKLGVLVAIAIIAPMLAMSQQSSAGASVSPGLQVQYLGTDANGVESYNFVSANDGNGSHILRVLRPTHPAPGVAHNFIYVLPVTAGLDTTYGDGLDTLRVLDAEDQYNLTIVEPTFGIAPWYANNSGDPSLQYETFMSSELQPWVSANLATSHAEQHWLIGFSKSGLGAQDLILKHPDLFTLAASWDFPAAMSAFDQYSDSAASYGTDANFQANYRLTRSFLAAHKAPFLTTTRLWIGGYNLFQSDVWDYDALLSSEGIAHTTGPSQMMVHSWDSAWVPIALAALYRDSVAIPGGGGTGGGGTGGGGTGGGGTGGGGSGGGGTGGGGSGGGGSGGGGSGGGGSGGAAGGGGATMPGITPVPIKVIAGTDRIGTAIAASQDTFGALTAQAVVIARSDGFADALAGTPFASAKVAPLLLNPTASLDPRVETEVKRVLGAGGTVYLLGGEQALGQSVAAGLAADGFNVVRLGGIDRFATAVDVANAIGRPRTILLATGVSAADALVSGAAAAGLSAAVLLTDDGSMPAETETFLSGNAGTTVYAVGGPAEAADPAALPIVGPNRYATGILVAQAFFGTSGAIGFASGVNFPDALSGGEHIALHGGPLILVDPNAVDPTVRAYLNAIGGTIADAFAYGGPSAIPSTMITALSNALGGA